MERITENAVDVLSVRFDLIAEQVVLETIERWRQAGERRYIVISNPHSVLTCHRDPEMHHATNEADLVLPDGVGIILAARLLKYTHNGRITGPYLMLKLCDWGRTHGYRHYFYGGRPGTAERLTTRLMEAYPGLAIAGTYCPPFRRPTADEDENIVATINAAKPDVLWVGLGAPKQEKWMRDHVGRVSATVMIGVGAAFDYHAGNVPWSPEWIRRLGLEWAYRWAHEPRRLWRRNLDSPLFLAKVMGQRFSRMFTLRQ